MKLEANKSLNNRASLSDDDSMDSCIFEPRVFQRVFTAGKSSKLSNLGWNTKPPPTLAIIKRKQSPLTRAASSKKIKSTRGSSVGTKQYIISKMTFRKSLAVSSNRDVSSLKTAVAERKPPPRSGMKSSSKPVPAEKYAKSPALSSNRELFSPLPCSTKSNSKPGSAVNNAKSFVVSSNRGVSSLKPVAGRKAPLPSFTQGNSKPGSVVKKLNAPLMGHRAGVTKNKKDNSVSAVIDMWLKRRLQKKERLELQLEHLDEEISSLKRKVAKTTKIEIEISDSDSDGLRDSDSDSDIDIV